MKRQATDTDAPASRPKQFCTPRVLMLVAVPDECDGLISKLGLQEVWRNERGGRQAIFEGLVEGNAAEGGLPRLAIQLAITGVLEHNAVNILSRLLYNKLGEENNSESSKSSLSGAPLFCVNFGCVGAYEHGSLAIGDTFFVHKVRHYDVDVPDNDPWDTRSFTLCTPANEERKDIVCTTGGRFTRTQPGCDCEDMELYGIASFCEYHGIKLYSVKYVANYCNESGVEDCFKNMAKVRAAAEEKVLQFIMHTQKYT